MMLLENVSCAMLMQLSPTCSVFTRTNYSILSSYLSNPDSYDINEMIKGSTEECSFTVAQIFVSLFILLVYQLNKWNK